MYFQYGQEETEYLSGKDEKLGAVIAQVGRVNREVDTDLFSAVVHHIVGQQISTKAQATIWQRMRGALGTVDAEHILEAGNEQLQLLGISCRKAEYITDFARKIQNGEFDLEGIWQKPDEEVIRELSALKGIGVWTAEMILLFCMQLIRIWQRWVVSRIGQVYIRCSIGVLFRGDSIWCWLLPLALCSM